VYKRRTKKCAKFLWTTLCVHRAAFTSVSVYETPRTETACTCYDIQRRRIAVKNEELSDANVQHRVDASPTQHLIRRGVLLATSKELPLAVDDLLPGTPGAARVGATTASDFLNNTRRRRL